MSAAESKASFFRQSGWMVLATVGGGVFMTAVHTVAGRMEQGELGVFLALLGCLNLLGIPASGLQTVFAQQTAAAHNEARERELIGTTRAVLMGIVALWLVMLLFALVFKQALLDTLKMSQEAALWMTMLLVLTALWTPVVKGLLQGRQNFMGLGWLAIIDGVLRFASVCVLVGAWKGGSSSAMLAAVIGQVVTLAAGLWWTRHIWNQRGTSPDWRKWLRTVVPLTVGAGAVIVLMSTDVVFVQTVFLKDETPFYQAPQKVGFALIQFTVPLAMVMYPKIVRSAATAQKSEALKLTLIATGVFGVLASLASMAMPRLPIQILYFTNKDLWAAAPLVPWFAWCMVALALANVLIGNLLARERFAIVPWLALLAAAYLATLFGLTDRLLSMERDAAFRLIVQVLTGFNLAAFALAWFFNRQPNASQGKLPEGI